MALVLLIILEKPAQNEVANKFFERFNKLQRIPLGATTPT